MKISSSAINHNWLLLSVVCFIGLILIQTNSVECRAVKESSQASASALSSSNTPESRRFRAMYRIIRAYLVTELEELDRLYDQYEDNDNADVETILYANNNEGDNTSVDKRQLKSQGIMERLKTKMGHDLNKFGWDRK